MSLSLSKLEGLLKSNRMIIQNIYTISDEAAYVEVFHADTAEVFLLYIPSKYKIKADDYKYSYEIKYIDIDDDSLLHKDKPVDVESSYEDLNLHLSPDKNEDLEKYMKDNYDHDVYLKDLRKEDAEHLRDMFYQLSRLKLCVKNVKYKLSITFKNYLASIKKDNSIECFVIKDLPIVDKKRIMITIDLKNYFDKHKRIHSDIKVIRSSIYKILDANQIKLTKLLNNIMEQKNTIMLCSDTIYKKKEETSIFLKGLEDLLDRILESEKATYSALLEAQKNISKSTSLTADTYRSHEVHSLQEKLEKIHNVKNEIINDIIDTRKRQDTTTLEIDKVLFDNNVMINKITKNFSNLLNAIQ